MNTRIATIQRVDMAPYVRLTGNQRSEIIGAHRERIPLAQIAANYQCHPETIRRAWRMRDRRNDKQQDLSRSERPRQSTEMQDQRLYRHLRIDNDLRWRDILDLHPLRRTQIQQRLAEIDPSFRQYLRH